MGCLGIIPACNEQENIGHAVATMRRAEGIDEVVVVDGYSIDATKQIALDAGATVVDRRTPGCPGKGIAMQTGIEEAQRRGADTVVFFDADIHNMEASMVDALLEPLQHGACDHAVATYRRKAGRVTELTARPLLKLLFPEVQVRQPLAGEFASRLAVLSELDLEPDWGVDSGILIDVAMQGHRIQEVDLGAKEHDMKALHDLHEMAVQVAGAILRRAERYGRIRVRGVPAWSVA